jgi:hypothetical protein
VKNSRWDFRNEDNFYIFICINYIHSETIFLNKKISKIQVSLNNTNMISVSEICVIAMLELLKIGVQKEGYIQQLMLSINFHKIILKSKVISNSQT